MGRNLNPAGTSSALQGSTTLNFSCISLTQLALHKCSWSQDCLILSWILLNFILLTSCSNQFQELTLHSKEAVLFSACVPLFQQTRLEQRQHGGATQKGFHHPLRAGDASHPSTPEGKLNIDWAAQRSPQPSCALCNLVVPEGTGVVMFWRELGLKQAGSSSRIPAAAALAHPYQFFWAGAGTHLQYFVSPTLLTCRQCQLLHTPPKLGSEVGPGCFWIQTWAWSGLCLYLLALKSSFSFTVLHSWLWERGPFAGSFALSANQPQSEAPSSSH